MLNEKQRECAILAAKGEKVIDICNRLGISKPTYYTWKSKPEFIELQEEFRQEVIKKTKSKMCSNIDSYLRELEDIAFNSENERVKLTALTYLIDQTIGKAGKEDKELTAKESKSDTLTWDNIVELNKEKAN